MPQNEDVFWFGKDTIIKETDKAILMEETKGEKHWLPKSQLTFYDHDFSVPRWLAEKNELTGSTKRTL